MCLTLTVDEKLQQISSCYETTFTSFLTSIPAPHGLPGHPPLPVKNACARPMHITFARAIIVQCCEAVSRHISALLLRSKTCCALCRFAQLPHYPRHSLHRSARRKLPQHCKNTWTLSHGALSGVTFIC